LFCQRQLYQRKRVDLTCKFVMGKQVKPAFSRTADPFSRGFLALYVEHSLLLCTVNRFKNVNLCLLSIALNVIAIVDSHGKDMRASFALLIQAN